MSSTSLTIDKLTTHNYHLWKFRMPMLLIEKELWQVANGEDKKLNIGKSDDAGDKVRTWNKSDQKALACICLAISDSESIHVQSCTTSVEAWKKLSDVYEKKGLARKVFLR